jgi:hypothetical protein
MPRRLNSAQYAANDPIGAADPSPATTPQKTDRTGTGAPASTAAGGQRPQRGITAAPSSPAPVSLPTKAVLFIAFAFAIMADPVSSVAYTIEASLRALHGYLGLLMATQIIVLGIILLVDVNYWQLVGRFPMGGGSAEGAARAFGTGWVFVPIGALIVDFVLTITISVAAGVSALIAYLPSLAPFRILLGLALLVLVAGLTWFGHGGRLTFAVMTVLFVAAAVAVLARGFAHPVITRGHAPPHRAGGRPAVRGAALLPCRDGPGHRHRSTVHGHRPARTARAR